MAEKECIDYRVDAVEEYAKAHYDQDGWDYVVETMTRWAIYDLVKWQRSGEGAVKKVASIVGAKDEQRQEVLSLADTPDGPEVLNDTSVMYCEKCGAAVHSLDEMHDHVCQEKDATDEVNVDLTDYVEPTVEQKDEANAEYLETADAHELNLDAPNGYFKNGNPKPVSKKDRERLGLLAS